MADSAETVKKTADTAKAAADKVQAQAEKIQAAGAQAFREGVDKSVAGLAELNAEGKKNLEALSAQTVAYGKKSWEDGVAAAQSLAQARSVQELLELQTSWAKSATEAYLSEVTKMTDVITASVKDSFKPINERVTASVEKFQAAR